MDSASALVQLVTEGDLEGVVKRLEDSPELLHSSKDWHGDNLLALACWCGHQALAKKLVELGAELNATNGSCSTPLHRACFKGNIDTVNLLLDSGADYKVKDRVIFFLCCFLFSSFTSFFFSSSSSPFFSLTHSFDLFRPLA